jgi:hypothetical protein
MRFSELIYNDEKIYSNYKINQILEKEKLQWLIDSEIEEAKIEIKNKTLIWHTGYFFGDWHYGIFKGGEFHGNFENGILEGGNFYGNFVSGIKLI